MKSLAVSLCQWFISVTDLKNKKHLRLTADAREVLDRFNRGQEDGWLFLLARRVEAGFISTADWAREVNNYARGLKRAGAQ